MHLRRYQRCQRTQVDTSTSSEASPSLISTSPSSTRRLRWLRVARISFRRLNWRISSDVIFVLDSAMIHQTTASPDELLARRKPATSHSQALNSSGPRTNTTPDCSIPADEEDDRRRISFNTDAPTGFRSYFSGEGLLGVMPREPFSSRVRIKTSWSVRECPYPARQPDIATSVAYDGTQGSESISLASARVRDAICHYHAELLEWGQVDRPRRRALLSPLRLLALDDAAAHADPSSFSIGHIPPLVRVSSSNAWRAARRTQADAASFICCLFFSKKKKI